ncbi:Uncharacterised protein [Mycobacteroides abscessus subsp. abscessus]|nr:Uncharacterised protein [Mycobacteroides abscessus subsp. abscessus]
MKLFRSRVRPVQAAVANRADFNPILLVTDYANAAQPTCVLGNG